MTTTRVIALALLLLTGAASAQDEWTRDAVNSLQSSDPWRRAEAVEWLYKQGPAAFAEVVHGLQSSHADARAIAADILLHYAKRMESVEPYGNALARGLKDSDAEVCKKIGKLLEKARPKNANALVRALAYKNPDARRIAAATLARFADPVVPRLIRLLEATSPYYRAGALLTLGAMDPPRTDLAPKVLPLLSDRNEDVRAAAATTLGKIGLSKEAVVRKLVGMLADDSPRVFLAAARSIALSPRSDSLLVRELERDGGVPDERVLCAIAKLQGCASTIEKVVVEADPDRRAQLLDASPVWILRGISDDTVAQLARWLDDEHVPTRRAAARILADSALTPLEESAVKALRGHCTDTDTLVRAAALRGLAEMTARDAPTVAALRVASMDPSPVVRAAAVCGLWQELEHVPGAIKELRELLTRHKSPGAARALGSMMPWSAIAIDDLIAASRSKDPELACAALRALGWFLRVSDRHGVDLRPTRLAMVPPEVRGACDRALRWLAAHQDMRRSGVGRADGRWDSDGFAAHDAQPSGGLGHPDCDVGLTAFALLAFLGAGHADTLSPYAEHVREGLQYLVREQREGGEIGSMKPRSFMIQHGIASVALCEATFLGRDPRYRTAAQKAVSYICMARNPKYGWRYVPRGGDNDIYHTTWMVTALRLGALAGFEVDPAAFRGALTYIDKLSDPNFGQIGYDYPGGSCARPVQRGTPETRATPPLPPELSVRPVGKIFETAAERRAREEHERERERRLAAWRTAYPDHGRSNSQASTAQGVWARMIAEPRFVNRELRWKGRNLCLELPPVWDPERQTIDLSYWYWGALALTHTTPKKLAAAWMQELREVLLANQRPDGSWDPAGPWGSVGGRLYATSAATIALLAPYRFPRGFLDPPSNYWPAHDRVRTAIEQAKRHKVWRCRVVATEMAEFVR